MKTHAVTSLNLSYGEMADNAPIVGA
jgi:hypothetical protein